VFTFEAGALRGEVRVSGDKSISHRALIFGAFASGRSLIEGANRGADVLATRDAIVALGARVDDRDSEIVVDGGALHNPAETIDARNSGTTARLLLGACAGHGINARFDGDASLRRRPMERVARYLRAMGAGVETSDGTLPATVRGVATPPGRDFALDIPSAQLKSAILLAHLDATGTVRISGDRFSRDHTERMLRHFGRSVTFDGRTIELEPGRLEPRRVRIPADLSGAAFFLVAAAITPGSDITVRDVGVNPTRTGLLDALRAMGADLDIVRERVLDGEPVADIRVRYRPLRATTISGELVVRAIDEIPVLAVAAAHAAGTTSVRDAGELRAKESDRLAAVGDILRRCGVKVVDRPDGFDVTGGGAHPPAQTLATEGDHRLAMSIAALAAPTGAHAVDDADCIAISFPEFVDRWSTAQA
jgi:3-phosphoshikimate 1-carboxyvinyltransferase